MTRGLPSATAIVVLMLCAIESGAQQEAGRHEPSVSSKVQVGSAAPEFELPALDSTKVKLSSFRGKVVLLEFMASWCPVCNRDRKQIARLRRVFGSKVAVISVSCDGGEMTDTTRLDIERFVARHKMDWPVLFDDTGMDGPVASSFGVTSLPVHVVIDRKGIVRFIGRGLDKDSQIERAIRRTLQL